MSNVDRYGRTSQAIVNSEETKMISRKEIGKLHEEEDRLLEEIRREALLRDLQECRSQRINMLRSFAERNDDQQRPSMQIIEDMQREENNRTDQVMKSLREIRAAEPVEKIFFKKFTLKDDVNNQEADVTVAITVKNKQPVTDLTKPVNINCTIAGNEMTVHTMFLGKEDIVVPDDIKKATFELRELSFSDDGAAGAEQHTVPDNGQTQPEEST